MERAIERGQIDMLGHEVLTYESNIAYTLRFMIDTKVRLAPSNADARLSG